MLRLTRFVLSHRRLVVLAWVLLTLAGGATAHLTSSRLSTAYTFPGQPGYETNLKIGAQYHAGGRQPPVVAVITLPAGQTADAGDGLAAADRGFAAAAASGPVRVADFADTQDKLFLVNGGKSTYALIFTKPTADGNDPAPAVQKAIAAALPPGASVRTTGFEQLIAAGSSTHGIGILAESMIGGLGALIILVFLFGSALAVLPLLTAMVSVMTTFLLVLGMTAVTTVSFVAQFLVALIGLGVGIDYSLLLVNRWREEREDGASSEEAVLRAAQTAGRAVLFSGVTVAIGLLSLVVVPVPFLRSLGYAGVFIPLVSVAVSSTLLPIVLVRFGEKLDRRRIGGGRASSGRLWAAWARGVVRARWVAAAAGVGILALLIAPFFGMHVGEPRTDALGAGGPARVVLEDLRAQGVPTGVITPIEVLATADGAPGLAEKLAALPGVVSVAAPATPQWTVNGTAMLDVLPADEGGSAAGGATLTRVLDAVHGDPAVLGVGGLAAQDRDFKHAVYGRFPLILGMLAVVTFVLLVKAFGSLLLPLKAVVLNLASLAAAYGVLTLVWQRGHGSDLLWSVPATGAITFWVPVIVFAFLFGLSIDYEVFILSRIKEAHDEHGEPRRAIVEGLSHTGRLVTGAALILCLAFLSLSTAPVVDIKMVATALGAGILIDATVVRALLVPALVALGGRAMWWMPGRSRPAAAVPAAGPPPARAGEEARR